MSVPCLTSLLNCTILAYDKVVTSADGGRQNWHKLTKDSMYETIGERIRHARELREFDQRKLSAQVEVAVRTLQRWEKGIQIPDSQALLRLAKFTSVRPEWLLTGEGEIYPSLPTNSKIIPLYKQQAFSKVSLVDIPLLASVPAGRTSPAFYVEQADRFVTVDDVRDPNA